MRFYTKKRLSETIDKYLKAPKTLAKNVKAVTALQNRDDFIREAFISGISSNTIRQRLLENKSLTLEVMFDQANAQKTLLKRT